MSATISIINTKDYDSIPEAVSKAIKLLEGKFRFEFTKAKNILLKPNLLTTKKDACTQPAFVEGVLSFLKQIGVSMNNIYLGDSPGQSEKVGSDVAKEIGIYDICEQYGINFIDFESAVISFTFVYYRIAKTIF